MQPRSTRAAHLVCSALLLLAGAASASEPAPTPGASSGGLQVDLSAGFAALTTVRGTYGQSGGLETGCSLGGRAGYFTGGVQADAVLTLGQAELFVGGHGGLAVRRGATEWSLLPEAGAHVLTDVGQDLFGDAVNPKTLVLPYAGVDLGFLHVRGPHRAAFGLWLYARVDLMRRTVEVESRGIIGGTQTDSYDVGGLAAGLAFRVQLGN